MKPFHDASPRADDHPPLALDIGCHSPVSLLRDVHSSFREEASERGISLGLVLPLTARSFHFDRHRVEHALTDMADKALTEARAGGTVTFSLQMDKENAYFVLETGRSPLRAGRNNEQDSGWNTDDPDCYFARRIAIAHGGELQSLAIREGAAQIVLRIPLLRPVDACDGPLLS